LHDTVTPYERPGFGLEPPVYRPVIALLGAAVAVFAGMAVGTAAILIPAPVAAVPFAVAIAAGCPLFGGWEIRAAVTFLRSAERRGENAVERLRAQLERLPEAEHPLGL
jgi:hypothetical protein